MKIAVIVLVGLGIGIVARASEDVRKWTDSTGTFSTEAEFVKLEGGIVTLKLPAGTLKRIPLQKLSPEDREFAKSVATKSATKPPGAVDPTYGTKFRGDYYPEIRNGKGQELDQEIPLGPIGGKAAVVYDKREAKIVELWENGPGSKAGLEVGDVILSANGKTFKTYSNKSGDGPEGAPESLALAIIDSQAEGRPLELGILRSGEKTTIEVAVPPLPAFSDTFPVDCGRTTALVESAAEWLADNQKDDGMWQSNQYSSAWCALSLLATGNPKYKRHIKKAARFFAEKYEMGKNPSSEELIAKTGGLDNWQNCMVGIFLGEYLLATGDEVVLDALIANCRRMEARLQAETGRLGHGSADLPYGGKGLVIINVHAHIMWALAAQYHDLEWNWEPWELSFKAVEASMTKDAAVGYNFSARSGGQSGSRTGAMATALAISDRDRSTARRMGTWLHEHRREFPNTHAMTSLGIVFGFMGIKNHSENALRKCLDDYRWMYSLVTPANFDHGSYYYGCRSNHGGDGYCKRRLVGNWVTLITLCSHRNDTLWMFGNRANDWYK